MENWKLLYNNLEEWKMENLNTHDEQAQEVKAGEQAPCILEEVCIEEMAVDGICGIY
jgi:hypothetical protein